MRVLIMKQLVIWRSLRRALSYRISSSMACSVPWSTLYLDWLKTGTKRESSLPRLEAGRAVGS